MKGWTVYLNQNWECSRLRKWEGESTFKALTVSKSWVQIYRRKQFCSPSAFPFNSDAESYLLLEEMHIFLQNNLSTGGLQQLWHCKNDPQWKPAEPQKDSSELPLQNKLSLICRECFPRFLLLLKTGLGLLQNSVFAVTCIRFQSSSRAHPLAVRVSAGLCIRRKAEVSSLWPNGYFRG